MEELYEELLVDRNFDFAQSIIYCYEINGARDKANLSFFFDFFELFAHQLSSTIWAHLKNHADAKEAFASDPVSIMDAVRVCSLAEALVYISIIGTEQNKDQEVSVMFNAIERAMMSMTGNIPRDFAQAKSLATEAIGEHSDPDDWQNAVAYPVVHHLWNLIYPEE